MNYYIFLTVIIVILIYILVLLVTRQIEDFELQNDPKILELKELVKPLFTDKFKSPILKKENTLNLLNRIRLYKGDKSYTINKSKIYLCLKDENGEYYDNNTLIYVLLHEIAHVLCVEIDHTPLFQEIFDELLDKATSMGLYNPDIPMLNNYCEYRS